MATAQKMVQRAKEQLAQLTGLKSDTVSAFFKDEQGWHVTVEFVELKRIPTATDVLASYQALLDEEGNLLSYQRTRRYHRGEVTEQEA